MNMHSLWLHTIIVVYYTIVSIVFLVHTCTQVTKNEAMWDIIYMASTFLTLWNFICQIAVFYGYLLYDIINVFQWHPKLNKMFKIFVDYCFYSFIAPLSLFITILFWLIWNYDKNLMFGFSGLMEVLIPLWLSHILHTFISVTVIVQTYHNRVYFETRYLVYGSALYASLYYLWIVIMNSFLNMWPYPLLDMTSPVQRHLLIVSLITLALLTVVLYNHFNRKHCLRNAKVESLSTRRLQETERITRE